MLIAIALAASLAAAQDSPPPKAAPVTEDKQAVRAKAVEPLTWVTVGDFPKSMFASGTHLDVSVKIDIDPTGRIVGCAASSTSDSPAFDLKVCNLIRARGRYEPARSANGTAIPWVSNMRYRLTITD